MLLNKLTPKQKFTFLRLVRDISISDKSLNPAERDIIKELCEEMGVSALDITSNIDMNTLEHIFDSREVRTIVMIELTRLAVIDQLFCYGESVLLNKLRIEFGFSAEDFGHIKSLAEVYNLLRQGIRTLARQ
ncbi:MAG: hypothetical protein WCF85_08340 [Rhodospirillaceae bacterium]